MDGSALKILEDGFSGIVDFIWVADLLMMSAK